MLSRQQLELINRKSLRYPLNIAEKDYILALTMQSIADSTLSEKLVFKGGTAIHHCYLEQHRFSEDLDFSSGGKSISFGGIKEVFKSLDFMEIKKYHHSNMTMKIERLRYSGPLEHPNSIKVEVDFHQNVLLPAKALPYRNVWGLEFSARVMDIREICAEKIRAMSDRARFRDFYDMILILEKFQLTLEEITGYIPLKEIRQPISKRNIIQNWTITRSQKDSEKQTIYYSRPVEDQQIEEMIHNLPFDQII